VGFWDRFRNKDTDQPKPAATAASPALPAVAWLPAASSPFGVRTLDLRPVTEGLTSTTTDPANAARAMSWGLETAKAIPPFEPAAGAETVRCSLEYAIAPAFPDGLMFAPRAMEEKWALFHRGGSIIAIRSWTGTVAVVARGTRVGDRLVLEELTSAAGGLGPFDDPAAVFDWLLRTHVLDETLPLPVSEAELALLAGAPLLAFSVFGRMAPFVASGYAPPPPAAPLRVFAPIVQAVRVGSAAQVAALLGEGADPDVPCPFQGYAALHFALVSGQVETMRALLAGKANPRLRTDRGMDPVGIGIVHGASPAILEELLAAGATLDVVNVDGFGLVHAAAETNRAEIIQWLIQRGLDVEARSGRGLTPLHVACGLGHVDAARALIAAGADTRAPSPLGTPREIAQQERHPAVAALLPEGR
jgi:hypothetical protein